MKSRYCYSNKLIYNNYPRPQNVSYKQREAVEARAAAVLGARKEFPGVTLADLYDPMAMPPKLHKAHEQLDRTVDLCYRRESFTSDRQRVEYLFALYEQLTAPLLPVTARKHRRK